MSNNNNKKVKEEKKSLNNDYNNDNNDNTEINVNQVNDKVNVLSSDVKTLMENQNQFQQQILENQNRFQQQILENQNRFQQQILKILQGQCPHTQAYHEPRVSSMSNPPPSQLTKQNICQEIKSDESFQLANEFMCHGVEADKKVQLRKKRKRHHRQLQQKRSFIKQTNIRPAISVIKTTKKYSDVVISKSKCVKCMNSSPYYRSNNEKLLTQYHNQVTSNQVLKLLPNGVLSYYNTLLNPPENGLFEHLLRLFSFL
jgi:hypothetical protein